MEEKKQVWSTADIIKNRNNWTLASDVELLKHIRSLSEKLVDKSHTTLQSLNSFEDDVNHACTSVANINNRFKALSDTQFIENKVRDDGVETQEIPVKVQTEGKESTESMTAKLNEALSNGIQVLRTQYDIIAITDSDSEGDEPQEVLLKARNPFMNRRLPYIIGSDDFNKHDHLGLVTSSEDEDDENNSEVDEEEDDNPEYSGRAVPRSEMVEDEIIKNRPQIIRVSSDSEDDEISYTDSEKPEQKVAHSNIPHTAQQMPKAPHNFAEHLEATLRNMGGNVIPPLVDDAFSPPPLPTNECDQFSDDEKSDDGSDIFAASRKVSKPRMKPNIVSDLFEDDVSQNFDSSRISEKSSTTTDISQSSNDTSTQKFTHVGENSEHSTPSTLPSEPLKPRIPSKPISNVPTPKMFSAVNAELNSKFNKKIVTRSESVSSDENDSTPSKSSSSNSNRPTTLPVRQPIKSNVIANESTTSKKASTPIVQKSSSLAGDIFENTSTKPSVSESTKSVVKPKSHNDKMHGSNASSLTSNNSAAKPKVHSLFDDDDSMDELFGSNSKHTKKTSLPTTVDSSREILFNDDDGDLFSTRQTQEKPSVKSSIGNTSSLVNKKMDLFNDDSDSGDDIFAIINSQKKKSASNFTKRDIEKQELPPNDDTFKTSVPSEGENDLFATKESKVASNISTRNEIYQSNSLGELESDRGNNKKVKNLFESDDESDDIFSTPPKSKEELMRSSSENSPRDLFISQTEEKGVIEQPKSKPIVSIKSDNILKNDDLFGFEDDESTHQEEVSQITSKPSVLPRSKFLKGSNEKDTDSSTSSIEKGSSKTKILFDSEDDESTNENIVRSKVLENSSERGTVAETEKENVSKKVLFKSEDNLFSNQDNFSIGVSKPSASPRSKFTENTDEKSTNLFASDSTENTPNLEIVKTENLSSNKKVNALSRQFEETRAPAVHTKILDETDDSAIVKSDWKPPTKTPAKLAINRGLNINVNALLPGSSWSSISKQVKETVADAEEEKSTASAPLPETKPVPLPETKPAPESVEKSADLLTTVAKERTKIAGRRRPPSRRARVTKALQSDVFASNSTADSTDDEPDSAYKTASESNSPEKKVTVEKTEVQSNDTKSDFISSLEETMFVPPSSAVTNYQKERGRLAKVARKRPPNISKEKTVNDGSSGDDKKNENKTANDLGNILITASSTRDPPAMLENDFRSLLSDSDKDDDSLDDILDKTERINDPIPQIDAESGLSFSPSLTTPKTPADTKSALFDTLEGENIDDLFSNLKLSNTSSLPTNDSPKNAEITISQNIVDRQTKNLTSKNEPEGFDKDLSSVSSNNGVKSAVETKISSKKSSDLFSFNENDSDDDLDELFSKVGSPKESTSKSNEPVSNSKMKLNTSEMLPQKAVADKVSATTPSDLFNESDPFTDVATTVKSRITSREADKSSVRSNKEAKELPKGSKSSVSLFGDNDDDDDDELFSSSKRSSMKPKMVASKSLFADDDDDDDSLFGNIISSRRNEKPEGTAMKSSSTATKPAEKERVVKLRSQTVERDPLTGKMIEK